MTYRVILTPNARNELYEDAMWWAEHRDSDQAIRWLMDSSVPENDFRSIRRHFRWQGKTMIFRSSFANCFMD